MVKVILFLSLFVTGVFAAADYSDRFFQNDCILFRYDGTFLKNFPGKMCLFLDDGRMVSASETEVRMMGPDQQVLWSFKAFPHHQLNLSPDGKRIIVLSSELLNEGKTLVRYDEFIILSLEGKLLARNSFRNLGKTFVDYPVDKGFSSADRERSHFNSLFEIGPQIKQRVPYLAEGNLIANSVELGTFILSRDLKEVLHSFKVPDSNNHRIHDVRVTPEGNYLLFKNESMTSSSDMVRSSIEELDPLTLRPVFSYRGERGVPFYSGICGGVEKLDPDTYVYSLVFSGTFLLSRKTGDVFHSVIEPNMIGKRIWLIQNMRLIHLSPKFRASWNI